MRVITTCEKYLQLMAELKNALIQREDEILAMVLAHISKTHMMQLGDPGTAKSLLCVLFAKAFPSDQSSKVAFFEHALSPFSKPVDLFGPVDILRLKNTGELAYKSDNFLPNARIAFLDEISRGENVMNDLMTITNERKITINGKTVNCPLETVVSATNFKFSSREFDAMRDRFLQWLTPKRIKPQDDAIIDLWETDDAKITVQIGEDELDVARAEVEAVVLTKALMKVFQTINIELEEKHGIIVTNRRSKWILKTIVKANAWLHGRPVASTDDLACIWTALWSDESQIPVVKKVLNKYINPEKQIIDEAFENAQILMQSWGTNPAANPAESVSDQLKAMKNKLTAIKKPKASNESSLKSTLFLVEKCQEKVADVMATKARQTGL